MTLSPNDLRIYQDILDAGREVYGDIPKEKTNISEWTPVIEDIKNQ